MITKTYRVLCGTEGRDSYRNGTHIGSVVAVMVYYFMDLASSQPAKDLAVDKWTYVVRSINLLNIDDIWYFDIICDIDEADETDLDTFITNNATVLGRYPPVLLNPNVTFTVISKATMLTDVLLKDLNGRGVTGQTVMFKGDDFEVLLDHSPSQQERNRINAMWGNTLVDV